MLIGSNYLKEIFIMVLNQYCVAFIDKELKSPNAGSLICSKNKAGNCN